jgi:hypothetical protein
MRKISENQRKSLINKLDEAKDAFHVTYKETISSVQANVPRGYRKHFLMAQYAVAKLDSLDKKELSELESACIIDSSIIKGGSLNTARNTINEYVSGYRLFLRDEWQQLYRVCYSVQGILIQKSELLYNIIPSIN